MEGMTCCCDRCQHKICTHRVPIFSSLDASEINSIVELITRKQYSKGEMLLQEGSSPQALIIINTGKVKAFRYTSEGKEQILYIFSENDFFGEKNLLREQEATYNVEALENTSVCMINKKDFQQLLRVHPDIGLKVMEELCNRLEKLERTVESMGMKSVESRVNIVLLEFSKKYGRKHPKGRLVELPLSREGIANYIGVTRETVSRKLGLLEDEGLIEVVGNKQIIIRDEKALEQSI